MAVLYSDCRAHAVSRAPGTVEDSNVAGNPCAWASEFGRCRVSCLPGKKRWPPLCTRQQARSEATGSARTALHPALTHSASLPFSSSRHSQLAPSRPRRRIIALVQSVIAAAWPPPLLAQRFTELPRIPERVSFSLERSRPATPSTNASPVEQHLSPTGLGNARRAD